METFSVYNQALALTFGIGVPMNYTNATNVLEKAADQSVPGPDIDSCLCLLGYLYLKRSNYRFQSEDGKKAVAAFQRSKDPRCQLYLGRMYKELSLSELKNNEKEKYNEYATKSEECFKECFQYLAKSSVSSSQDPWSLELLGYVYDQGIGIKPDGKEAFKWYLESAKQSSSSRSQLGIYYSIGKYVDQDHKEAFKHFSISAAQGHPYAQTELAKYYLEGLVVEKDENKAFQLLQTAEAAAGYSYTQLQLGKLFKNGCGTARNLSEARRLFRQAAETGNEKIKEEATKELGSITEE